jgi:hypothetical protein
VIKSRMRSAAHGARIEDKRGAYGVLVGRIEGLETNLKPRRRWENNVKRIVKKWDGLEWTGLIWL